LESVLERDLWLGRASAAYAAGRAIREWPDYAAAVLAFVAP